MDHSYQPHRSGDPPPPPPHLHHHHHHHLQQPNPNWYPPPHDYPPQSYHHHLPPPPQHPHQWGPPPSHHPVPSPPQPYPPPPPPYPGGPAAPHPPGPANPWPHHPAAAPPPHPQHGYPPPPLPNQAWANPPWIHNQGWEYSDRNSYNNEEDWATKARAWAAATSATESHQTQPHAVPTGRTEDHNYAYHDQYQLPAGPPMETVRPSLPQPSNQPLPVNMTSQQKETNYMHGSTSYSSGSMYVTDGYMSQNAGAEVAIADKDRMASPFPSTYEQEVSYNYSSTPGHGDAMVHYPSSQVQPSPTVSSVQDGFPQAPPNMPVLNPALEQHHFVHNEQLKLIIDPSDQPLEFNNRPAPGVPGGPVGVVDHDAVTTSAHSWPPSASVGFFPRAPLPPPGTQLDPSVVSQPSLPVHPAPLFGGVSGSNYRPSIPPAAFGVGAVTSLHTTEAFPADTNGTLNLAERSKKPPVPNWLREELLKNKSVLASTPMQQSATFPSMGPEDGEKPLKRSDQSDNKSLDSAKSTEDDEEDEDEVEAGRTAAINQEIKRVLTEVLLKVTDDLFDEIATKVLNEDDQIAESSEHPTTMSRKDPGSADSTPKVSAKVLVPAKTINSSHDDSGPSSPEGDILGLASYASDDDDDDEKDDTVQSDLPPSKVAAGKAHHQEGRQGIDSGRDGKGSNEDSRNFFKNHNDRNPLIQSASTLDDYVSNHEKSPTRENRNPEDQQPINKPQNGEVYSDASISLQPKDIISAKDDKTPDCMDGDAQNGKVSSSIHTMESKGILSNHRQSEKTSKREDSVKEAKAIDRTERETSNAHEDKNGLEGRIDKKDSLKERGQGGSASHGADRRDSYSRSTSKHHNTKDDRKDSAKDARERNREDINRRERGKDEEDRSTKGLAGHSSKRSPSPRGRSRTRKESSSHVRGSVSSDEPSDNSKRRKLHSRKHSLSPSPPRSRNRQVSRSPHSKHSHRRHSPYSSAQRKRRSRSRTPVKRR